MDQPPNTPLPPLGSIRGRGTSLNPAGRFDRLSLHVLPSHLGDLANDAPNGRQLPTSVQPDDSRSVINRVDSPDLSFNWTLNPYRGCEHGCIYCYARPGHEYLGLSSGLDFETRLFAKHDAPDLLRRELARPAWRGEPIVLSGVTDPYQPIERDLRITRRCLEVCRDFRQPVALITKNRLIERDADLLADLARDHAAAAAISLTSLDPHLAAIMEPRASAPRDRLAAIRALADAGVPVTVMTAPIIPRINDHEIPALLRAAADAGASSAAYITLRLPYQIKDLFVDWLRRHFPDRADAVLNALRQIHGGALYRASFGLRQRGSGPLAAQIRSLHRAFAATYNLDRPRPPLRSAAFRKPDDQPSLFAP
ncbi:MAG: PA0069 family radical SAM protein [Phycisphaerae bacterium]|nr:PA0069 family radical SAM protein [Phycisphaerae bacterium]